MSLAMQAMDALAPTPQARALLETVVAKHRMKTIYSDRYRDDEYEYRHVKVHKDYEALLPGRLLTEVECTILGIQQSPGWEHYMIHKPEPCVLLFRRPLPPQ